MKTRWNLILRIVIFALLALALIAPAGHTQVKPCCAITALDPRAATVTAKENGTSRTFVFKVPDAKLFATVRVGTPVYANFTTKQVSLDGKSVCCQIIRTNTPSAASRSIAMFKLARETAGGDPLHSVLLHLAWPSAWNYSVAVRSMRDKHGRVFDPPPSQAQLGIGSRREVQGTAGAVFRRRIRVRAPARDRRAGQTTRKISR